MVQAPRRTTIRGPTFIRLLARLTDVDVPPSRQSLSDRLGQWLAWTHAIALSTALDGNPSAASADVPAFDGAVEGECARVRMALADAIAGDRPFNASKLRGAAPAVDGADVAVDYPVFRQRYIAMQRAMQTATGNLRGRLRDMLAHTSADMARLAEVDAVMELALSPREQKLLATVPDLLGNHFEHLRQAVPAATPDAWLGVFRRDMRSVLLAELDVRFQPVEGLLAALRTCSLENHAQKTS